MLSGGGSDGHDWKVERKIKIGEVEGGSFESILGN